MKARSLRKYKETVEIRSLLFNRLRTHRYFPIAVMALLITGAACIHVWQRVVVLSLVKEVAALEKENRGLVDDAHKIQTEIAALSMATRIERFASDTLGLQRPSPNGLYTMTPVDIEMAESQDAFAALVSSIRRMADYLPERTEARAAAQELEPIKFDTVAYEGAGE
ncbi:MAG: cell division protein FtsL [Candidatus Zixiibacteriota bacterium]